MPRTQVTIASAVDSRRPRIIAWWAHPSAQDAGPALQARHADCFSPGWNQPWHGGEFIRHDPTLLRAAQIHADAAQMPAEVGGVPGDKLHFHWVKGMFDGATEALTSGLESLCSFIGIKARAPPPPPPPRARGCSPVLSLQPRIRRPCFTTLTLTVHRGRLDDSCDQSTA